MKSHATNKNNFELHQQKKKLPVNTAFEVRSKKFFQN